MLPFTHLLINSIPLCTPLILFICEMTLCLFFFFVLTNLSFFIPRCLLYLSLFFLLLAEDELGAWCVEHGLTEDTGRVLREEGFTTLRYLCLLTPEEVDESFKQPRLLPLAQCLALKHAVAQLGQRQSYAEQREDPTGQCQNHAGQGQGFGGQPQNHTGQRRDLSGQRRNHEGQRQDLSGQRQNHAGQRQGLSGQSQNQFGQRQDLSRQHQDQQKRRRDPSGQLKSMGAVCNFEEEDAIEGT